MDKLSNIELRRAVLAVVLLLVVVVTSGCGSFEIKPWLKPYERGHLADPIMALSRDPVDESYMAHVYEAREAIRGADGGSGGGCGCN